MKILQLDESEELLSGGSVITLGNFDGVHLGHLALIHSLEKASRLDSLPSVLVTYYPNPSIVLGKNRDLKSIYPEDKKKEILSQFNFDFLLTIPFTESFSQKTAFDFIKEILVQKLNAKHIIIGYNHFFGKGREGDFSFLQNYSGTFGYTVEQIQPVYQGADKISSSLIRNLISEGKIERANELLGRAFSLRGVVVEGMKRGRTISFPTANLLPPESSLTPGRGVYAAYTHFDGHRYRSMINIGNRPTFSGMHVTIEAHILDFSGDLYGKQIEHHFIHKIREEKKFENASELMSQLYRDKEMVMQLFRQNAQMAQQQQ